jgi:hypothetical protein
MSEPTRPALPPSSGAAAFLAERHQRQAAQQVRRRRLQRYARESALDRVAERLKAALPRPEGGRPDSAKPNSVADALLQFVSECRALEAGDGLDRVVQTGASTEAERCARDLCGVAAAGDRQALVAQIHALAGHSRAFQGDVWALVGWLPREIFHPERASPVSPDVTASPPTGPAGEAGEEPTREMGPNAHAPGSGRKQQPVALTSTQLEVLQALELTKAVKSDGRKSAREIAQRIGGSCTSESLKRPLRRLKMLGLVAAVNDQGP